jgi:3-carboxy-cis,cis-muconate cycloisomerase
VEVEIALAGAEARLGIIPSSAAECISQAKANAIDVEALAKGTVRSGFPIIALVQELRRLAGPDAASYVHWGATTQDIMDTACVLQIRTVCEVFKSRLRVILRNLIELSDRHRTTVMAGRTHGQQALPITFGLKVANWLAPLVRNAERLDELSPRLFVVQFGGGAGTLAALGDKGLAVTRGLAEELNLNVPLSPWHSQRDNFAEFAGWLSLVTGSLGKMAQDVILLAQSEVGEVAETSDAGRGGSSTMPQKTNPITSELILAAARQNASLLSAMHHAMVHEHERATHGWQMEWLTLPQMMDLTGGALRHASDLSGNLQVNAKAMRANIDRSNGVVLAEAAVFALAKTMPREEAEALVKKAVNQEKPLIDVVRQLAPQAAVDWQALANPENYLGETTKIIEGVLQKAKRML